MPESPHYSPVFIVIFPASNPSPVDLLLKVCQNQYKRLRIVGLVQDWKMGKLIEAKKLLNRGRFIQYGPIIVNYWDIQVIGLINTVFTAFGKLPEKLSRAVGSLAIKNTFLKSSKSQYQGSKGRSWIEYKPVARVLEAVKLERQIHLTSSGSIFRWKYLFNFK